MKKRYILGGILASAALLLSPIYATRGMACDGFSVVTDSHEAIYVDTVDVDTMDVDAEDTDTAAVGAVDVVDDDEDKALPWPQNVVSRIDRIFRETTIFNTSMVGMQIYDLTADSVIYEHNARQLMRPASTLKMMVAVSALDFLGADYKYKTRLSYSGRLDSLVLQGNIYCKGDLDPTFDSDDMSKFVEQISALGIDTINGNIVLDKTMKDKDLLGEGWCWDDDNPVLSPLLVGRKDEFEDRLKRRLRQKGIFLTGDCKEGSVPGGTTTIYTKETALLDVMHRQMKRSDNLYSESVFYHIASDYIGGRGGATARNGRQAMNRLVSKLGFKPSAYYIADGSGLSLYNYVSPELEVAFLKYAYRHSRIYDNLLPCLPIAGVDGTLGKRMRSGAAHDNVKAKTGTVTGVSALAGYCTAANGHRLCFSIINMGIRHASSGRNFQDKVCQALCR